MTALGAELLAKVAAFAEAHPEVVAAAEAEAAQAAAVVEHRAFDFFAVVRELARRTGLIGGADLAMSEKTEAAIRAHERAYPAPEPGRPDTVVPGPGPIPPVEA